jgi:hypothetical protein
MTIILNGVLLSSRPKQAACEVPIIAAAGIPRALIATYCHAELRISSSMPSFQTMGLVVFVKSATVRYQKDFTIILI